MLKQFFILSLLIPCMGYANEIKESRALVVASQEAIISSELAAKVAEVLIEETQSFKNGDLLINFDCRLYEAQEDVVAANMNSALIKYKSDQQMLQMRSIGKYELELSKSEHEKAVSEHLIAKLNLERCKIYAPFDGAVIELFANPYETVQPQQELLRILKTDILELEMVVSSEWVSWLKVGHPVIVFIEEINEEFKATVSGIGANVDPVSQTIQLRATIDNNNESLLPGMSGRVTF